MDNAKLLELAQGVLVGLGLGNVACAVEDLAVVQVEIPTDLTKKQLLTVSTLVAERGLGDAADSAGEKLRDRAEKVKDEIEEEVSEHFSGDKWRAPKNPFTGKRK